MSRPTPIGHPPNDCPHGVDAGAYVLHALALEDARAFEAHLETCERCQAEVAEHQVVVESLPVAAPQMPPPPELKDRIMRVVTSEADLLRAAGPEADRPPAPAPERRWWSGLLVRPGIAAGLACALLAVGVGAGLLVSGDDGPSSRVVAAQVKPTGARASLRVTGSRAALVLHGMPSPPIGQVYQVWFQRANGAPEPTHTLFNVRSDGDATVQITESVEGVRKIMVTAEPSGGSRRPTSAPVLVATPS